MNVARTRASVKLDALEMDLIVITSMQVRCAEKQLEIQCYSPLCPTNLGLSLTRNCLWQQSESLGFVTQILTVNWLSFQTIKNTFEPFISLKK